MPSDVELTAKYEQIAHAIADSRPPAGELAERVSLKLPSIRALMQQYRVSQATIERSLSLLVTRGVVERVPEKGFFFRSEPAGGRAGDSSRIKSVDLCFFYEKKMLSRNILYSSMMARMMAAADEYGFRLHMSAYNESGSIEGFRQELKERSPDAMILMSVTRVDFELILNSMNIPTLLLLPNAVQRSSNRVVIDDLGAMEQIVDHLYSLGHRRIAMLHGQGFHNYYHRAQALRIEGFYAAMKRREQFVAANYVDYGGFTADEGYDAAIALLKDPSSRPTAIICNDYNFLGVYQAAEKCGLRVPEDLSVVGFDNIMPAASASPSLTTVDIHSDKIVDVTIQAIRDLMQNRSLRGQVFTIPTELVLRESTATAPGR